MPSPPRSPACSGCSSSSLRSAPSPRRSASSASPGTRRFAATRRRRWSSAPPPGSRSATTSCSSSPAGRRSPGSLLEAAAIDGAGGARRFWTIVFPLLAPTTFFLLVVNTVYALFDTFGIIHAVTSGGPGKATETLVYKVRPLRNHRSSLRIRFLGGGSVDRPRSGVPEPHLPPHATLGTDSARTSTSARLRFIARKASVSAAVLRASPK